MSSPWIKRQKKHPLQNKPHSKGAAYAVWEKKFPGCQPAKGGPYPPVPKPPSEDYDGWVKYYVHLVGGSLEKLNGLQFDLEQKPNNKKKITKTLENLGKKLNIGQGQNPNKLVWPLTGGYDCKLQGTNLSKTGFTTFRVNITFTQESKYFMVINFKIRIIATKPPIFPLSSSSSYLMTSSSS